MALAQTGCLGPPLVTPLPNRSTRQCMSARTTSTLANRRILLAVSGSIAAYKAPLVLRLLQKTGADVRVLLTDAAQRFIGKQTFTGLGAQTFTSMWDEPGEPHVELARWAEAILVAPMSADSMARYASGRSCDLLSATLLCATCPVSVAPAMHPSMWAAPASQSNARQLFKRGVRFVGPVDGEVASGEVGLGRMEEPEGIVRAVERSLSEPGPLQGRHIVITAGPTTEAIDPARVLSNRSSGKMGYALAEVALGMGADVSLISGPVALTPPAGCTFIPVTSARDMQQALDDVLGPDLAEADAVVMAAAVSDYRPQVTSASKLKRSAGTRSLELVSNPDLIAELGRRRSGLRPVLVAFALETAPPDELVMIARSKLIDKRVDLVVANRADESLNQDQANVLLVTPVDWTAVERQQKSRVALRILDWVAHRLAGPEIAEQTE